ncbi:hypothetical protein BJ170DRAFT_682189 [Xylariales sp. AK1849]|nr:hypothetical protein BJ170DRAFT_682189 [Xylariales sp. AK1849]
MSDGLKPNTTDDYGLRQLIRLNAKWDNSTTLRRFYYIYGKYLSPDLQERISTRYAKKCYHERAVWKDLFSRRRSTNNESTTRFSCLPGPHGEATEKLRCLTFLIKGKPYEKVYEALDRWVFWDLGNAISQASDVCSLVNKAIVKRDAQYIDCSIPADLLNLKSEFYCAVQRFWAAEFCRDDCLGHYIAGDKSGSEEQDHDDEI